MLYETVELTKILGCAVNQSTIDMRVVVKKNLQLHNIKIILILTLIQCQHLDANINRCMNMNVNKILI